MTNKTPTRDLLADMAAYRARVNERLPQLVPDADVPPQRLHQAIRYSLLGPGKRVRPILTLLSARAFGAGEAAALDPACALEMVHAASLIVDDFPFMDDSAERRGRPTSHLAFGMQTATLASLALLNRAFSVVSEATGTSDATRLELVSRLSGALGDCGGAIAGQDEDLETADRPDLSLRQLERMVAHKTSALFVAAAEFGALIAGASRDEQAAAREFALSFGLCFQALDDLADQPDARDGALRPAARDRHGKATFASLLGPDGAWDAATEYAWTAIERLEPIGLADSALADLALSLIGADRTRRAVSSL